MTKRVILTAGFLSVVLGAAAGVWFTLNPPPEYVLEIVDGALMGAFMGGIVFAAVGIWAVIILEDVLGVDVL